MNSRFMDAKEICDEFGIHRNTLTNWINAGRFPAPLRLSLRKHVWLRASVEKLYQNADQSDSERPELRYYEED